MYNLKLRSATTKDIDKMGYLLKEHAPNKWNYLPEEGVTKELRDIAKGKAIAVLTGSKKQIVGFAIAYLEFNRFPEYTASETPVEKLGYIGDVVVHNKHTGKGIGTSLIEEAKAILLKYGVSEIYIDCHEENLAYSIPSQKF